MQETIAWSETGCWWTKVAVKTAKFLFSMFQICLPARLEETSSKRNFRGFQVSTGLRFFAPSAKKATTMMSNKRSKACKDVSRKCHQFLQKDFSAYFARMFLWMKMHRYGCFRKTVCKRKCLTGPQRCEWVGSSSLKWMSLSYETQCTGSGFQRDTTHMPFGRVSSCRMLVSMVTSLFVSYSCVNGNIFLRVVFLCQWKHFCTGELLSWRPRWS